MIRTFAQTDRALTGSGASTRAVSEDIRAPLRIHTRANAKILTGRKMMRKISQAIYNLAIGTVLLASGAANAEQNCAPRELALAQLEKRFDEHVVGRGIAPSGKVMFELFVSEAGSWTMLVSDPEGRSCFVVVGEDWHQITPIAGNPA